MIRQYDKTVVVNWWDEWCTDDDVRVGVIGHGGLLRAFSFARPIRGSGHVWGYIPETWVSKYNLRMKLCGISRSSAILGSDSPQSNNRKDHSLWVTPFIPRERPNVKHAIAGYLRLPQPTSAPALMWVLHWLRCWAEELGYATGNSPEDYSQIRGGCSCPWMIAVD